MLSTEIFILLCATIFIFAALLSLLFYLIIRKSIEIKNRKEIEHHKEVFSPIIFNYIMEGNISRSLNSKSPLKLKAVEELLKKFFEILEGEHEIKNLATVAELHLKDYYSDSLKSRRWSERMNALYHIEDFKMLSLEEEVVNLIKRKTTTKDEIVIALRTLAAFQYKGLYNLLEGGQISLSDYEYRNILIRLNQLELEQFLLSFHKVHETLQCAILEVISIRKELHYLGFIESICKNYRGEVRLRALKALASIGYVKDYQIYIPFSQSEKWQERVVVAKLFGTLKESSLIPILIELLHDSSWWVRSQAGQSLLLFPNGKKLLQNVLQTSKDPFAKDMAWEWINKGD
ncbi:hypothetical protein SM124_19850 [Bacillus sp. 31A1R]|uniref:HEAT repeat domain-containing protein n=1 Tax=Robertmurraya mangrovi TaxID=3098077 RepID=A0ABU5J3K5_9BACI|nr:hypothetical protein [Bacillus sp. 31A1R]MDZ5473978.1 hypothetical protein [Bacillus sp. 31A1R]